MADRVFVAALEPHRVNVGLIVGDDGALLVDTGNTAEQGAEVRASAEELTGVPVTHVVLTHDHHDHVGGLDGVRASGEATKSSRAAAASTRSRVLGATP